MNQDRFEQLIASLQESTHVTEFEFPSTIPIIGRLVRAIRVTWNNVSTRWYVKDFARQQVEFQRKLIHLLQMGQQESVLENARLKQQIDLLQLRLNTAQTMQQRDTEEIVRVQIIQRQDQAV